MTFVPAPLVADVRACSFNAWYPQFRALAPQSEVIPLSQEFVTYLLADGVFVSEDNTALPVRREENIFECPDSAFTRGDEQDSSGDDEDVADTSKKSFPEIEDAIDAALARLGGAALPKLNWSAPKDTVWLFQHGSMKCQTKDEVLLMLKSSDNLVHDLCHAFQQCADCPPEPPTEPFVLVLKKWLDMKPSMEFRCFVRDRRLIGISQRNVGDFYPFLPAMADELADRLDVFFEDHIAPAFSATAYAFDAYLASTGRIRLVDFNPWGGATLPLLFTWAELEELAAASTGEGEGEAADAASGDLGQDLPVVRVVDSALGIMRPGLRLGVPVEMYDTSQTSALAALMQRCRQDAYDAEEPGDDE